jgi:hypothetical protein
MRYAFGAAFSAVVSLFLGFAQPVFSQQNDVVWVQVEAQPSLAQAQERARDYAARLPDVSGYALGNGWYGIVLGPYAPADADQVLQVYRAEGSIPRDSYIAFNTSFGQQFWPLGENSLNLNVLEAPAVAPAPAPLVATPEPLAELNPQPEPDETRAQALRSESALTTVERQALQTALKWAGFYDAAIDGAFGNGTRTSMAGWQVSNGFEDTGVLTTRQRAVLLEAYNAVLKGMNLQLVRDLDAGIEMRIPTGVVEFKKYEPPFAHYDQSGDINARVLLISQPGDQATLFGLYDIMQTLEIVPLAGPRDRGNDSFRLIGENGSMISQTEVSLQDGQIKGFTLVWPAGDEERRRRVLVEMQSSFTRLDGILAASAGSFDTQSIDLVSGLEVRKPRMSRSGFYIDTSGTVVTTADAVDGCTRITLEDDYDAKLVSVDPALGVAVLRPTQSLTPMTSALFGTAPPRLQSEVALGGYSFGGILGAPSVTFGVLADLRGLDGEPNLKRLAMASLPGDAGGPVLDTGGNLIGMLLPAASGERKLPEDVSFALDGAAIKSLLGVAGVKVVSSDSVGQMADEDLRALASDMTVLVQCWD